MAEDVEVVEGERVRILFTGGRCIHSRHCVLGRPDVFVPNVAGAWIHPDAARPEEIVELAHHCPSGAIRFERKDGGPVETAPRVNTVQVRENGPLAVHAALEIKARPPEFRATLCRCGQSKRKPYCDMSHVESGFQASGEPPTQAAPALTRRDGPLSVTPSKNGPLLFAGAVEIVSGTGRKVTATLKCALCRCGHSQNKPFCDGSHAKVGFQADGA